MINAPPHPNKEDGTTRRVGVEIELAGIDIAGIARIVHAAVGGDIEVESTHRHQIRGTEFGDFTVELDAQILHADGSETDAQESSTVALENNARDLLGRTVSGLVPAEIITPPLPWNRLDIADDLIGELRARGAKGTDDSPLYGFGVHLNPEIPGADVDQIVRTLRSFLIMADWLRDQIQVDTTRRLLPHIDRFPRDYILAVVDPGYEPGQDRFIDDYLDANPTRNRELDMLPLFKHLDEKRVLDRLDDTLINARPTYHYRLPNCSISNPNWTIGTEWNRWVQVEKLAEDQNELNEKAGHFVDIHSRPAPERWLDEVKGYFAQDE